MSIRLEIEPNKIIEAVNRSGIELDEFIKSIPQLSSWLEKKSNPTFKQLQKFSKKSNTPFGYFFTSEIPKPSSPIPFFRTSDSNISVNVSDTINILLQRQEWLSNYKRLEFVEDPINFVGLYKSDGSVSVKDVSTKIREILGLPIGWASSEQNWQYALNRLKEKIEDAGVIIVSNGVVGNNTRRKIEVNECRGFVLVDKYAPFIFVNASDTKAAQMFTLIHEFTHILFGMSAGFDLDKLLPVDDPIEVLCDAVAAEFLVPESNFSEMWEYNKDFYELARKYKVSPIVVARRAMDLGFITRADYFLFYNTYMKEYFDRKSEQPSGGSFYNTAKNRISLPFAAYVKTAVDSNKLLHRDAYKLMGIKGNTYRKFVNEFL